MANNLSNFIIFIIIYQVDMYVCIYVEQFILIPRNSYILLHPPMLTLFGVPTCVRA